MARRNKPKTRFHRCARCRSPIPSGYKSCGVCGYNANAAADLFNEALRMFPGSREVVNDHDTRPGSTLD
jgi:hypothetical protein